MGPVNDAGNLWAPTKDNFRQAFNELSQELTPDSTLYLVMEDHGGIDAFQLNDTTTVSAGEIKECLDNIQDDRCSGECFGVRTPGCNDAVGSKVVVTYDACYSGSLMDELRKDLSDQDHGDRVVLVSRSIEQKTACPRYTILKTE